MTAQAVRIACAVFILFLCAAAPRATTYHIELQCGSSPCTFPVSAVMERYARLQTHITTVRLTIDPAPPVMPRVTWRAADSSRITIAHSNPFEGVFHFAGDTAPTPAPNPLVGMLVVGDTGATSVSVEVGPPVNTRISFPVFAYHTVELGCYFASWNGVAFEGGAAVNAQRPQDSDVYVTGPSDNRDSFNNCGPKFAGGDHTLHAPYGATIINVPFNSVAPDAWRDEFHETPLSLRASGGLVAKTRNGRIVKIELQPEQRSIQGRFLVADGTRFADNAPAVSTFVQEPLR